MNYINELFERMTDEDFCRATFEEYENRMSQRDDADYEINQPQWNKMLSVLDFFYTLAADGNGEVEPCEVTPRYEHGGITAYFYVIDVNSRNVQKFHELYDYASAVTIDATLDGKVCVSATVPYVFKKKSGGISNGNA